MSSVQGAGRQFLKGLVPQAIAESRALSRVPSETRMNLAVGLPLRNRDELERLLNELADPDSPNFRKYLTPAQFTERFGPSEEDYQALAAYFEANNLAVTATHPNRMILDVSGTVTAVESTFHVNMLRWRHPTRGEFFAPDREPSLDAGTAILDVTGLDNFVVPRPMDLKARPLDNATPDKTSTSGSAVPLTTGSGTAGLFTGNDFRAAYAPSVTLNGSGQAIGLFELDGFYASDVQANFKQAGLAPMPIQTVLLDGFNGAPSASGNVEVTLDIMMAAYMAPSASRIIVYEGTNWNDVLNRMATDNLASQLSSSWCFSPTNATTEQIFKQMIAQGQSLFQASGDSGAYHGAIMPPADDPNVTVVGGTNLTTSGAGGAWQSETTWSSGGGGVSTTWPIPSYQQSANTSAAGGSATMRNIPDVAMIADLQIFLICNNGQPSEVGGTSAAAPLWAGFMALANQQAAANHQPPVGFLNPTIYRLGAGANFSTDLHDIVTGTNGFSALPGYDLATGWGTPTGQPLINDLTGVSNAAAFNLTALPSSVSLAPGASSSTVINVVPESGFSAAVTLSVSGLPAGVTASFSPASATTSSTLTLTATSSAAPATAIVTITGVSGSLTSNATLAVTITSLPSFSVSATPSGLRIAQGGTATSTIIVTPQNGFSGTVALNASGLPAGVTASFGPISASGMSTLTLNAAGSTVPAGYGIMVIGTSGSVTSTTAINLTVSAAAGFNIAGSPTVLNVSKGGSASSTINVTPSGSFFGVVSFSASGLPAGMTATFTPPAATRATTVKFNATASAATGTWAITLTGSSGAITRTAMITITVASSGTFTLSATPANLQLPAGGSATGVIAINAQNSFNSPVTLAASGLPAGVTATFGPVSAARTVLLTLNAAGTAAAGAATVTITGTSGTISSKTAIAVTVAQPPTFVLTPAPSALNVTQGASVSTTITLTPQNGFRSIVTLTLSGVPSGVLASFSAGQNPAVCLLRFSVSGTAAVGRSNVTIVGKSGNLIQSVPITLNVTSAGGNVSVSLADAYNVMAAVTDGAQFLSGGGLDAVGHAYSGTLLGSTQTIGGAQFSFGAPNALNAVSSKVIPLPAGNFATLKVLATAVNGNQTAQKFTVLYTDGTSATFTQSLSDWCTPQGNSGESKAVTMPYRNASTGTRDTRTITLYSYIFPLSSSKTVKSVELPSNRNVVILAMNLGSGSSTASTDGAPTINRPHIVLYPGTNRPKR